MHNGSDEKTCHDCFHYKIPRLTGAIDLAEIRGECREGPPSVTTLPQPGGQFALFVNYPTFPPTMRACDRHKPKLKVDA